LDKYPDLAGIRIMGPEDLIGGDAYALWQYGSGGSTVHKNLQYLQNVAADSQAATALGFFCIHGYASDGVSAANATPVSWNWWANGWPGSPAAGIPANVKGFQFYGKKSWMTETSGEAPSWLSPAVGFPNNGAWSIALRIHQALTAGQQSGWVYWQLTDGNPVGAQTLTSSTLTNSSPKYVAAKHFFRYIRPGSMRVNATVLGTTNLLASAYLHETNGTLTVVLINTSSNAQSATLNLPSTPVGIGSLQVFTSSNSNLWLTSSIPVTGGAAPIMVPGYGVVTLYAVAPPKLTETEGQNGNLNLSWSPESLGFVVRSTSSLVPPVNWAIDTNSYSVTNGVATLTVAKDQPTRFYRLSLP
jgi:hypothetical protein